MIGRLRSIWSASLSSCRSGWLTAPGRWSSANSLAGRTSMSWAPSCTICRTWSRSIKEGTTSILAVSSWPRVEMLGEVGGQGQRGIKVEQQAACLQRPHDEPRTDLVVAPHQAQGPAEHQVDDRAEHVEVAEPLPDLALGEGHGPRAGWWIEVRTQSDQVVLAGPVFGDWAPDDAH